MLHNYIFKESRGTFEYFLFTTNVKAILEYNGNIQK